MKVLRTLFYFVLYSKLEEGARGRGGGGGRKAFAFTV